MKRNTQESGETRSRAVANTVSPVQTKRNNDLPEELQAKMETSFGSDFSNVKIHKNSKQAAKLNALAFTQGEQIHFAPGQFNPHSNKGKNMIGHEFTHIIQQRQGIVQPTGIIAKNHLLNNSQRLEHQADRFGSRAVNGTTVNLFSPTRFSNSVVIQKTPPAAAAGLFGIAGLEAVEAITLGLTAVQVGAMGLQQSGNLSYSPTHVSRLMEAEPKPYSRSYTHQIFGAFAEGGLGNDFSRAQFELKVDSNDFGEIVAFVRKNQSRTTSFDKSSMYVNFTNLGMYPRQGGERDPRAWPIRMSYEGNYNPYGNGNWDFQGQFEFNAFGYFKILEHEVASRSLMDFAIFGSPEDYVYKYGNHLPYSIPELPESQRRILDERYADDPNFNPGE